MSRFLALRRHHWALFAAGLLELLIANYSLWVHWQSGAPRGERLVHSGEGLAIYSDGLGYYAWLRSLLIDGDWDFDNEFDEHNPGANALPPKERRTPIGRRCNQWSVGPACVWAPLVIPGHRILVSFPAPWPADGYSLPYQVLVASGTLLLSFVGLYCLYQACSRFAQPDTAAVVAIWLTLGTTVVYYNAIEQSMAHGPATAIVAVLVAYWLTTYGSDELRRWCFVGMLVGAAALMRWQLATFAVLPIAEAVEKRCFGKLFLAASGAVFAFLPQMVAWKCVYGSWLVAPLPVVAHWLTPDWYVILLSPDRSLLYWTPVVGIAALAAFLSAIGPCGHRPLRILFFAFVLQAYVVASLWGRPGVYLGESFGMRHLTETVVALGPGLATFLDRASAPVRPRLAALGWLLVAWNLLLLCQYRYGFLPQETGAGLDVLACNAHWLLRHRPWLALSHALAAPALMGWMLARTTDRPGDIHSENRRPANWQLTARGQAAKGK